MESTAPSVDFEMQVSNVFSYLLVWNHIFHCFSKMSSKDIAYLKRTHFELARRTLKPNAVFLLENTDVSQC